MSKAEPFSAWSVACANFNEQGLLMKICTNLSTLQAQVALVEAMFKDEALLKLYREGDKMSAHQTKHDVGHAFSVTTLARELTAEIHSRNPSLLSDELREVVIPAGAFLHDIGRAIDVNNHAAAGAKVSREYLRGKGLSREAVNLICSIVACHRSDTFLRLEMEHLRTVPHLAIVVIADKCVGDEDRVRPGKAMLLKCLRLLGVAQRNFWKNAEHDRVNFAIKQANLIVDSDDCPTPEHAGAIVLKLQLDSKVAPPEEVLELYGNRFHSCGRAAKSLGFLFRMEFNGTRFHYDDEADAWIPVRSFSVPMT
jgi:hypothetical protein